uniref:Uncharacterized protein n=1 Tax=Pseudictyota dubia TaxID=2749911 RepID=A0A7R9WBE5_9STRA
MKEVTMVTTVWTTSARMPQSFHHTTFTIIRGHLRAHRSFAAMILFITLIIKTVWNTHKIVRGQLLWVIAIATLSGKARISFAAGIITFMARLSLITTATLNFQHTAEIANGLSSLGRGEKGNKGYSG